MNPNDPNRLLVTGSRYYDNRDKVTRALQPFACLGLCLVYGDYNGLDKLARDVWTEFGLPVHGIPARWEQYGNRAGPIRNQAMVDLGGYVACVAFPLARSIGTWDCMRRADKAGIIVLEVK